MQHPTTLLIVFIIGCTGYHDDAPQPGDAKHQSMIVPDANSHLSPPQLAGILPQRENASSHNPNHTEWPALVDKHVEFTGKLSRDYSKDAIGPQLFFNGTYLDVRGELSADAFSADQIKVTGMLTRVHHSGVPLGGQQGLNGRVWETYLLIVDKWSVVEPAHGE